MAQSIMQTERKCYVCGAENNLHLHHIFYGTANRRQSDRYGCTCYLCASHHNMSGHGIHADKELDLAVKKACQKEFEKTYSRDEFMKIFGRNYL